MTLFIFIIVSGFLNWVDLSFVLMNSKQIFVHYVVRLEKLNGITKSSIFFVSLIMFFFSRTRIRRLFLQRFLWIVIIWALGFILTFLLYFAYIWKLCKLASDVRLRVESYFYLEVSKTKNVCRVQYFGWNILVHLVFTNV